MEELKQEENKKLAPKRIFRLTFNPSFDTLPGCICDYEHPTHPNNCKKCKYDVYCKRWTAQAK